MISIDNRLAACAEMISGKGTVCDVGTDHAYLPVYLLENKLCNRVVACDINDGPLKFARQTLKKYQCEDKIELVKSDGLKNISFENVTDVVIAGMGGETISEILSDNEWIKNDVNIILQPMTRAGYLRIWLYENGFEIAEEKAVENERFVYTVIKTFYSNYRFKISKTAEVIGKIDLKSQSGMKYCENQLFKIQQIAFGLAKAGKNTEIVKYHEIAESLLILMEGKMSNVSEIYKYINSVAPFSVQEKWDNSGLLTGHMSNMVSKILISLDITNEVIDEAKEIGAELIISHHPVIFKPLYSLCDDEPSCRLLKNGISAICTHTPYDVAENGMSDILMEAAGFIKKEGVLEVSEGKEKNYGFGSVGISNCEYKPNELAKKLKDVLGCKVVKYNDSKKPITKAAFCTGSGGSFISEAIHLGADAYITAEVKHDQWLFAKQKGISVFDCGHFHTENIGMKKLYKMLLVEFPNIKVKMSEVNKDPVNYVL